MLLLQVGARCARPVRPRFAAGGRGARPSPLPTYLPPPENGAAARQTQQRGLARGRSSQPSPCLHRPSPTRYSVPPDASGDNRPALIHTPTSPKGPPSGFDIRADTPDARRKMAGEIRATIFH
ncbi:Hypothetical Protein RRSL_03351 [Ralstonia solanacearum UW551]|uniref:Uncharacterized protein n=1 Tax=Ralstonia solanacearum (strain UW551) TaxID=342110 RepID=A0AB33VFL0_RALSU|nr:Hypothetical Protein RRSL_03351 [Ralstonia solanacearum UW551]